MPGTKEDEGQSEEVTKSVGGEESKFSGVTSTEK